MKVVVTDCNFTSFAEEQQMCERAGHELTIYQCKTVDEVIEQAADADALFVQYAPITEAVFARLQNCKVIVRYGIGVDSIDLAAAKQHGVAICNVPDYGIDEVADHAAALALTQARQIPYFDRAIRQGEWPAATPTPMLSFSDMTFAALGAGRIGRATLARMQAFGFNCAAYDPFVSAEDLAAINVQKLSLNEVFAEADILSLHLPLIEQTQHLVNAERLKAMKSNAILINTSRGGLIDTHALADALQRGEIAHAGIDVFEAEPMEADHPLRECWNAALTPHMAYYSAASIVRLQRYAAEEVERALKGEALRCQVA